MRQNGHGTLTLEDARTWVEETGLCLFLPRRQFSTSIAPSFVEAIAGQRNVNPEARHIALAEELLVRLELDGVAVRLNLLGMPGEQPDFVVAAWVLPYVYALRGDRDWRRTPQLTGSRQVSQLAIQAYKLIEVGDSTIAELRQGLGREVTEAAVVRAITELWQQLRIIPVIAAPGHPAKWQLLRHRFQKAIAEGASTSQVTAISVLASIYLQAVIAASMEEVEIFLSPLTARSKVREVLRGLVATRQVHTISLGHAPHFYVAGTLPEFTAPPTVYSSSAMPAYYLHARGHEEDLPEPEPVVAPPPPPPVAAEPRPVAAETHVPRTPPARKPAAAQKPAAARPHFSRGASRATSHPGNRSASRSASRPGARDRKPAQTSSGRTTRRTGADARSSASHPAGSRPASSRPASTRPTNGARPASPSRWSQNGAKSTNGTHKSAHAGNGSSNGSGNGSSNGSGNGSGYASRSNGNGSHAGQSNSRPAKPASAWGQRNGHANGSKPTPKAGSAARGASSSRKPAVAASAKTRNAKRYGFTARPKQGNKKRG